jgi:uncharacterized membrane protein
LGRFFQWLFERTKAKGGIVERYEALGLMLFVAIPLPVTGAWTGTVAAFIFQIKRKYAFPSIIAGVCIAGVIVSAFVALRWIGAILAGIILLLLTGRILWRKLG